jgi:hypothetical protein
MAWHSFHEGETFLRDDVIAACEQRILDGGVIAVEQKRYLLDRIRVAASAHIVFSPQGSGWGASPFNPNNWKTLDGEPIVPPGESVEELTE